MADMRLFHHFLITAYPHLPVGADKIWITVIPSFAHNVRQRRQLYSMITDLGSTSTSYIRFWRYLHRILMLFQILAPLSRPYGIESWQSSHSTKRFQCRQSLGASRMRAWLRH